MNSDYVLDKIKSTTELVENNVLNLRISEIKDVNLITGKRKVEFPIIYKFYGGGSTWHATPNAAGDRIGEEKNNCYTSNVKVSIVDATGEMYDYPVVNVETSVTDVSSSGCKKVENGYSPASLINYTVVWKYDYCD